MVVVSIYANIALITVVSVCIPKDLACITVVSTLPYYHIGNALMCLISLPRISFVSCHSTALLIFRILLINLAHLLLEFQFKNTLFNAWIAKHSSKQEAQIDSHKHINHTLHEKSHTFQHLKHKDEVTSCYSSEDQQHWEEMIVRSYVNERRPAIFITA